MAANNNAAQPPLAHGHPQEIILELQRINQNLIQQNTFLNDTLINKNADIKKLKRSENRLKKVQSEFTLFKAKYHNFKTDSKAYEELDPQGQRTRKHRLKKLFLEVSKLLPGDITHFSVDLKTAGGTVIIQDILKPMCSVIADKYAAETRERRKALQFLFVKDDNLISDKACHEIRQIKGINSPSLSQLKKLRIEQNAFIDIEMKELPNGVICAKRNLTSLVEKMILETSAILKCARRKDAHDFKIWLKFATDGAKICRSINAVKGAISVTKFPNADDYTIPVEFEKSIESELLAYIYEGQYKLQCTISAFPSLFLVKLFKTIFL